MAALTLRWILCVTFALPVNVGAAQPKTQTGSGGAPPKGPTSPPTTYKGGGDNSGEPGKKPEDGKKSARSTGKFGEIWGIGANGKEIYLEGQVDGEGRPRVWSYSNLNSAYVRRGVVIVEAAHLDGTVRWARGHTYYKSLLAELNGQSNKPTPVAETPKVTEKPLTGNLVDRVRVQSEGGKRLELAYFQGRKDLQGRELVFRPAVVDGKVSLQVYQVGTLNGLSVEWNSKLMPHDDLIKELEKVNVEHRQDWRQSDRDMYRERLARLKAESFQQWLSSHLEPKVETASEAKVQVETKMPEVRRRNIPSRYEALPAPKEVIPPSRALVVQKEKARALQKVAPGSNSTNSPYIESTGRLETPAKQYTYTVTHQAPSNFPELPRPENPIPKDRAIVPYEPPGRAIINTAPGNNSTNSPYIESVGQPKNLTAPGESPVELEKTLEWNAGKTSRVGRWVKNIRTGENLFGPRKLNGNSPYDPLTETKSAGPSMNFTQNAFYFYAALGVASAYTLMAEHPNNPMAWSAYLDTLTDPVGYLSFAGFIVAAAPFYRRLDGAPTMGQYPLFAAALVAGSLASTSISVYANDPNFKKCAGFAAYAIHGKFERSMEACQALFNNWTTGTYHRDMLEEISIRFIPMAANVALTGALFLGGINGTRFLINRSAWINALRTVAVAKTPRSGGFGTVALTVGQFALFLGAYQLTDRLFETEKGTREGILAGDGFLSGPYSYYFGDVNGANINDAENRIFSEWTRLKKVGFADPGSYDKLCVDTRRKDSIFYDCDRPDAIDFEKSLNRYGKLLGSWRATQMKPTMDAFQSWNAKSHDFNTMLSASYNFYKKSLEQIQGLEGAKPFSYENLRDNLGGQDILVSGQENTWKYVATYKLEEFLLTSMACGPEVEGVGVRSTWDRIRQFSKSWITGNSRPDQMVEDRSGRSTRFYPPRITKALPGTLDTVCEHQGREWLFGVLPPPPDLMSTLATIPANTKTVGFYAGAKYYRGLLDYVKENIRESVWAGGFQADTFNDWWTENVVPDARRVRDVHREEFKKMLESTYKPALSRRDYYWCETGPSVATGLDKYLGLLNSNSNDCGPKKLHRLSYGPLNGLRDEMRLYLAMTLDLLFSQRSTVAANPATLNDNEAITLAQSLVVQFDEVLARFKEIEPGGRKDIFDVRDQFEANLGQYFALFAPAKPITSAKDMSPYAVRLTALLNSKVAALFGDAANYYNVLSKFDNVDWPAVELKATPGDQ